MTSAFILFITLVFVFLPVMVVSIPGGWSDADVNNAEVQSAGLFAVQARFAQDTVVPTFTVIEAYKKVSFERYYYTTSSYEARYPIR